MQSYYTTIPTYITTREDLLDGEKIFYGTIQSLCCKYGFCWANNKTLAKIAHKSISQIHRYIRKLVSAGLLFVEVEFHNERKIWTRETWVNRKELKKSFDQDFEFNQRFYRCVMDDTGGVSCMTPNNNKKINITKNKEDRAKPQPPASPPVHLFSKKKDMEQTLGDPPRSREKPPSNKEDLELTKREYQDLYYLLGSDLEKYEEKRRVHLKKCPNSLHHKKRAAETIREWYTQDSEEKRVRKEAIKNNTTQAAVKLEVKARKLVEDILLKNPHLVNNIRPYKNDVDFVTGVSGNSCRHLASIPYKDPDFFNRVKDIMDKLRKYDKLYFEFDFVGPEYNE